MSEPKIYVPKVSAKEHVFRDGGSQIKLGFNAAALIEFVKAHTNEKGYINLLVTKRKEVGQFGDTHAVSLDTWVPKQGGQSAPAAEGEQTQAQRLLAERRASAPRPTAAPAGQAKASEWEEDSEVPF